MEAITLTNENIKECIEEFRNLPEIDYKMPTCQICEEPKVDCVFYANIFACFNCHILNSSKN